MQLVVTGDQGPGTRRVTPTEVSAVLLAALKDRAERHLGGAIEGAVITVPAYFDEGQRQATKDAGRLAGLDVLRLVNEPTAAALAYGLDRRKQGIFAIYDLGGGTFDLSILEQKDGIFAVLATAGDTALGGDDMDRALGSLILSTQSEETSSQIMGDPQKHKQFLSHARQCKHQLTQATEVQIHREPWMPSSFQPCTVSREAFESVIDVLLQRTITLCKRALHDAALSVSQIDGVVLVGGATRIPLVQKKVEAFFGQAPLCDLNPDEVVALGAAIQADVIANGRADVLLIDVTPLSLGLVTMGDVVEHIIPRNTRIPTMARQEFTTYADGQTGFDLHVVQGERDQASQCRSLARFALRGIPPMPAGMARLEVTFIVDENGLLQIDARERTSGIRTQVQVRPSYGLTAEQIEQMLLDGYQHAEEDVAYRQLTAAITEADQLLLALKKAMHDPATSWSVEQRNSLSQYMASLAQAIDQKNRRAIQEWTQKTEAVSLPLIQQRMNQQIQQALAGKAVDSFEKK